MAAASTPERTQKEQECLRKMLRVLQNLKFELTNQPVIGRTNKKDQLAWFDRVFDYAGEIATASDCRDLSLKLADLGNAILESVGSKRTLRPAYEQTENDSFPPDKIMTDSNRDRLVKITDILIESVRKRMKRLNIEVVKQKPPTINVEAKGTKLVYIVGVVSLYPVIFAELARELGLTPIAPFLSIVGAFLSFMFFTELAAICLAKPFWVFDPQEAGGAISSVVESRRWLIVVLSGIFLLFAAQGRWLLQGLWELVSPLGVVAYGVVVSVISVLFSAFFYPWTKWRYNQFLCCPVCGQHAVTPEALDAHCKTTYGFSVKEIVEHGLNKRKKQSKAVSKRELRERGFLIMVPFYVGVETLTFLKEQNVSSFLLMLTMCAFFLVLDLFQADYHVYRNEAKQRTEAQERLDREAFSAVVTMIGFILVTTYLFGTLFFLVNGVLFPGATVTVQVSVFAYNLGVGAALVVPAMSRHPGLFVRGLERTRLGLPLKSIAGYCGLIYSTDLLIGLWASTTIKVVEASSLFGVFCGFIILLLWAREVWQKLRHPS